MHHCPRQPSKASWVLVDERCVHAEICKGRCFDCMWAWMHGCIHSKRTHKKQREYMHTTGSSQYACSMWQEPYRKCVCVCVCVCVLGQTEGTWHDNLGSDTNEGTSTLTEDTDDGRPEGTFRIFLGSGSETKALLASRKAALHLRWSVDVIDVLMQTKTPHAFQKPHSFSWETPCRHCMSPQNQYAWGEIAQNKPLKRYNTQCGSLELHVVALRYDRYCDKA